jgi:hypothetical protein
MTTIISMPLHTCESERLQLAALNRVNGKSWPHIARLPRYSGIPFTSLYMWAKGERPLADEHLARLGIPHEKPAPVCNNPDCEGYGEPHVWDCKTQTVKRKGKPREYKDLFAMPKNVLLWKLENRS